MKLVRLLFALVTLAGVSACATPMQVAEVQSVTAQARPSEGTAFTRELFASYQDRARHEAEVEYEWRHAVIFARKGARAAAGEVVSPEELSAWELPEAAIPTLAGARERLIGYFAEGAREREPETSAKAQVAFDCWVEEEWEHDADTECRDTFLALEKDLKAPPAPKAAEPAAEEPAKSYVVTFDFDKAEIKAGTMQTLWEAAQVAKAKKPKLIRIHGHTDEMGGKGYNQKLSEKRAKAVADQLGKLGLDPAAFEVKGFGKAKPAVSNKPPRKEEKNRRVTIEFVYDTAPATSSSAAPAVEAPVQADAGSPAAEPMGQGMADAEANLMAFGFDAPPSGVPPAA